MNLPINNTNDIVVSAPGSVATPAGGTVTYFFDSTNSNQLSYKDDGGNVVVADQGPDNMDACVCNLLTEFTCTIKDALLSGVFTPEHYNGALASGFEVTTPSGTYSVSVQTP